jgi:hypothetical protein
MKKENIVHGLLVRTKTGNDKNPRWPDGRPVLIGKIHSYVQGESHYIWRVIWPRGEITTHHVTELISA